VNSSANNLTRRLESQSKFMEEHFKLSEGPNEPDLKEEDVKEILHDVLNELYYSQGKKRTHTSQCIYCT
jgi:hypothetical protein